MLDVMELTGGRKPADLDYQGLWDAVAKHLRHQKKRAIEGAGCTYLNDHGEGCAIGALIPVEMLCGRDAADLRGSVRTLLGIAPEIRTWLGVERLDSPRARFLAELQVFHDTYFWVTPGKVVREKAFEQFATGHGLIYNPPVQLAETA